MSLTPQEAAGPPTFIIILGLGNEVDGLPALRSEIETFACWRELRLPDVTSRSDDIYDFAAIADRFSKEINALTAGPFYLGGYSTGGVLAFEAACRLGKLGRPPKALILFDRSSVNSARPRAEPT